MLILVPFTLIGYACGGKATSDLLGSSGGGASSGGTSSGGVSSSGGTSGGTGSSGSSGMVPLDCKEPSDCALVPRTCCGVCGEPSLGDMIAVPDSQADTYRTNVCTPPEPCPKCAVQVNPNLIATCRGQKCTGVDIRTDADYASCNKNEDCVLRAGNECCELCAPVEPSQYIALNIKGARTLAETACVGAPPCTKCPPGPPPLVKAVCVSNRCAVRKP
jgi:hypothetical protein